MSPNVGLFIIGILGVGHAIGHSKKTQKSLFDSPTKKVITKVTIREDVFKSGVAIKKRSVFISGHQTSISIEDEFWSELKSFCKRNNKSLNQIITEVDKSRSGNLSSALRVFILKNKSGYT